MKLIRIIKRIISEPSPFDLTNQLALRRGILSLGWADYLYGPSIIIPGLFDSLQLRQ